MPRGDGTGPLGIPGRGCGRGGPGFSKGGRGWRNWVHATGLPGMERQTLKNHAEALQSELDFIKQRLGEIETGSTAE